MRLLSLTLVLACGLRAGVIQSLNVPVPMRDGVRLSTNIFRPGEPERAPTILFRTPYGKGSGMSENHQAFVNAGYAVVVQDVRGRHGSEGVFRPLDQEGPDGYDTLEWIAAQPWSDGRVGMLGSSYLGIVQWKVALLNNPHLAAICPQVSGYDDYIDRFYSTGGAMKIGNRLLWMSQQMRAPGFKPDFGKFVLHLPLRTADQAATGQTLEMYQQVVEHPSYDGFWRKMSTREQIGKIRIPVFSVGGWYDNFAQSDLEAFAALRGNSPMRRILIGPWPHDVRQTFAGVDYGPEASVPLRDLQLQWFDKWLKGKDAPMLSRPPARIFVMGANRWRDESDWPPARVRYTPMYLQSRGHANTLNGDGTLGPEPDPRESADRYRYDPRDPAPTRGGPVCCRPQDFPWGPMDQREVESRPDVLVYTSPPLREPVEATGPVRVVLYVSTTARDTDFTAKLVDVWPDGHARNLTDGILRLRYRKGIDQPENAVPGRTYRIVVDAGVTSNVFLKGHRIRVEISSSNFPRFDRNPNTGGAIAEETRQVTASQVVYHGPRRRSHLLLPVVP
ncbi:MAG: CocE/NonD family hydrolase [Bryobacteraceae bacterium]